LSPKRIVYRVSTGKFAKLCLENIVDKRALVVIEIEIDGLGAFGSYHIAKELIEANRKTDVISSIVITELGF
jgi:hypothetical protein